MPFVRPSLSDLVARVKSDLRGRLSLAGPLVRRAMADVVATVWAGTVHMLHGHLEWISHQIFPDTSDPDQLLQQASLYAITPIPASYASGSFVATGTNGSTIPIGTILQLDPGTTYQVTTPATIASGVASVSVRATLAGAAANVGAGAILTFQSPLPGVNATGTVDSGAITGGFDQEPIDGTRARLIERLQEPPEGGADQDYVAWAKSVDGITRVWVYPNENGLGTVVVRFVLDNQVSSIFPTSPEVAAVQTALDANRPVTAQVFAETATALPVNFTIHLNPDTSDIRDAVTAEIKDLLFRDAAPGDGSTSLGTIKLSHIRTAIGDAADDYTMTVPSADVVPTLGQMAQLGTITWV